MAKILSINNDIVEIGGDDGALTEVRLADLSFAPRVGDIVDVYRSETSYRVVLSDKQSNGGVSQSGQGININLTQAQTTANQTPAYIQAGKVVNKTAYAICAILLGSLGIHKFLAGKIGMGVLYLLFCWSGIPGIIGLIEGVVALTKQADANGNIVV